MFVTVLGTPSPLTAIVLQTVQMLTEVAVGPYHWIAAGTAEELQKAWAGRGSRPVVMFGDIPSRDITGTTEKSGARFVVVLEPPATIVEHVAATRDMTGLPALRFASQSLATLHDLALSPAAWRLSPEILPLPIADVVERLCTLYGIALTPTSRAEVLRKIRSQKPDAVTLRDLMPSADGQSAPSADMALAARVLDGYHDLVAGRPAVRFEWPPGVFLGARPHGAPITGTIDLIGGRRCFAFGPFFHLPAGSWRVTVDFKVWDNVSGNTLKIDAYTDRVITEGTSLLPRRGHFTCAIDFAIEEPRVPLQIRLFNEEGAIEGSFDLHGMIVERSG